MKVRVVICSYGCDEPGCDEASSAYDDAPATFAEARAYAIDDGWKVDTRGRARCPKHNPDKLRKAP